MAMTPKPLRWSSDFNVTPSQLTPKLPGDKIILPQSALEQLLAAAPLQETNPRVPSPRSHTAAFDPLNPYTFAAESSAREQARSRQHQLPQPLTFRVVNPQNGRAIYAGIREFSAEDNEVGMSAFIRAALGLEEESSTQFDPKNPPGSPSSPGSSAPPPRRLVTIHAKQLPKGTYVRLRPLEAGYDPEDWKALLERHLRDNYTTLTTGEFLTVPGGQDGSFRFLVDRVEPEGDGICVVDTDLEVDIVALSEDQARDTLRKRLEKASRAPGTQTGSSMGGALAWGVSVAGQVIPGEYVDYELENWDRDCPIEVELEVESVEHADAYPLISPFSTRQRNRPRGDEHVFSDFSGRPSKRIRVQPTNMALEGAEALYISVYAFAAAPADLQPSMTPLQFSLRVAGSSPVDDGEKHATEATTPTSQNPEDDVQCKNCHQWVPQRTLMLHENFCFRNNVLCTHCHTVFQRRSLEWEHHWHCDRDDSHGNDLPSKHRHEAIFHTAWRCRACGLEEQDHGLPQLARHRTTDCPVKPILCQFCHLVVPQKGDSDPELHDPEVLMSGLTPHELVDGGRTTECHLCGKIVRLRDMRTHLRHHDLERLSRPPPSICRNQNCGRTLDRRSAQGTAAIPGTDTLGLCSICFGPLYVDMYDPEGKALRRRIERRYLSQMMSGCGKPWCQNEYCKNGRQAKKSSTSDRSIDTQTNNALPAATALATVRPLIDAVGLQSGRPNTTAPFYFCTDQVGQQRRVLAEMLAAECTATGGKTYNLAWCIAAVEATAGNMEKAPEWLENWAPAQGEDSSGALA